MAKLAKFLQAAAGSAGGAGLDIDEVFSTYLYEGTGSAQTITNGIDISGEGGLVWIKKRNASKNHGLMDTEQGLDGSSNSRYLKSNTTDAQATGGQITAYNSNGFTTGAADMTNGSGEEYVSWTFRKAPKFFDVVTYTGNGVSGRQIAHNLGTTVGMLIVKRTDSTGDWSVFHRKLNGGTNSGNYRLELQGTVNESTTSHWNNTVPSSTTFTVGNSNTVNGNNQTYVAYVFAHNNNDGGFGSSGDQDIIKCDSFSSDGSGNATVNVGFEPQWIMIKRTDGANNWQIANTVQGWDLNAANPLFPNLSNAESDVWGGGLYPTSTGFKLEGVLGNSRTFIYMAIRRGPLAAPDDATKVFDVKQGVNSIPAFNSGFTVDLALSAANITSTTAWRIRNRLTGANYLLPNDTNAETSSTSSTYQFDLQTGYGQATNLTSVYAWMWKRAPSYFDVVAYSGTGSARTVSHNLSAVPEMMWCKNRSAGTPWMVYHSSLGNQAYLQLNDTAAQVTGNTSRWNATTPTASVFSVGDSGSVNGTSNNIIAYLFATVAGVSKVGSFTSTGSDMTIDCGFSNGARFVLLKKTNATDQWYLWDSVRGIVSGNDSRLKLNDTTAAVSHSDNIDPDSSGFILHDNILGGSGNTFIFYAIA